MAVPVKTNEPLIIAAGDTIAFTRALQNFPASQGWSLKYEIRGLGAAIEFTSVAQGDSHSISVSSATTSAWVTGDFVLAGYAVNSGTAERIQFYLNNLTITENLVTATDQESQQTHAQKMIALIEAVQLGKATHDILESEIEQTRIKRLSPKELREERYSWLAERQREVAKENAANGRSNGRNRYVAFVDPTGSGLGQFGASPIYPFGR